MWDTPIETTRWFTGQDWNGLKKLMYSVGRGYCHISAKGNAISLVQFWPQEIQSREWEKKNKRTIWAWVNSSARRLSWDTLHSLCFCRLSLMRSFFFLRNFHKPRGMLTHHDWSSLTAPGPYLMPTGLSCCPLSPPDCFTLRQLPSLSSFLQLVVSSLGSAFPTPLPVSSKISSLVWFRTKTVKGVVYLAHPLHSVTLMHFAMSWTC